MTCPLCKEAPLEFSSRSNEYECLGCHFHTPKIFAEKLRELRIKRNAARIDVTTSKIEIKEILEFIAEFLFDKDGAPVWYE